MMLIKISLDTHTHPFAYLSTYLQGCDAIFSFLTQSIVIQASSKQSSTNFKDQFSIPIEHTYFLIL